MFSTQNPTFLNLKHKGFPLLSQRISRKNNKFQKLRRTISGLKLKRPGVFREIKYGIGGICNFYSANKCVRASSESKVMYDSEYNTMLEQEQEQQHRTESWFQRTTVQRYETIYIFFCLLALLELMKWKNISRNLQHSTFRLIANI